VWFWLAALIALFVILAAFNVVAIHLPGGALVGWLGISVLILILGVYPWGP
jgi:hypothetical protein